MKTWSLLLACFVLAAADTPPPKNGVIKPNTEIDPNMKVVPPRTAARTPVVHPQTGTKGHNAVVIPK